MPTSSSEASSTSFERATSGSVTVGDGYRLELSIWRQSRIPLVTEVQQRVSKSVALPLVSCSPLDNRECSPTFEQPVTQRFLQTTGIDQNGVVRGVIPTGVSLSNVGMGGHQLVTADRSAEIELRVRDPTCFFVRASREANCDVELEELVHRPDGSVIEFFSFQDAPADRVLPLVREEPSITDARLISDGPDGCLFEFLVVDHCVTATLVEAGAIAHTVSASSGEGRVVAVVPAQADVRRVFEAFRRAHPDAELIAQHDRGPPIRTRQGLSVTLADQLTEKQFEVLETAHRLGYFEWPREHTAAECAAALGITQPTFSQHVRAAENTVFGLLFGPDRDP